MKEWTRFYNKDDHRTPALCRQTKHRKLQFSTDLEESEISRWRINTNDVIATAYWWTAARIGGSARLLCNSSHTNPNQNHTTHIHVWKSKSNLKLPHWSIVTPSFKNSKHVATWHWRLLVMMVSSRLMRSRSHHQN